MKEDLRKNICNHYGSLTDALIDVHENRHKAHAVTLVESHLKTTHFSSQKNKTPLPVGLEFIAADNEKTTTTTTTPTKMTKQQQQQNALTKHTSVLISGAIENTYNAIKTTIGNVAWKTFVQIGNVPDKLDTMINYLENIKNQVRRRLVKTMNWVGAHLASFWDYIKSLMPNNASWLTNMFGQLSFDWLASTITYATKKVLFTLSSGLLTIFRAIQSIIFTAVDNLTSVMGGVMDSVIKFKGLFSKAYVSTVHAVAFYMSCNSDLSRFALSEKYKFKEHMDAYRIEMGTINNSILTSLKLDLKENPDRRETLESAMTSSNFISKVLDFVMDTTIFDWVVSGIEWFTNTLKRMVSTVQTAFQASVGYAAMFSTIFSKDLVKMRTYVESLQSSVTLSDAIGSAEELLKDSGDSIPEEKKKSLQESIILAQTVWASSYSTQNEAVVDSFTGKTVRARFEMNHVVADTLTTLSMDQEIDDAFLEKLDLLQEHYLGQKLENAIWKRQEALGVLHFNYLDAVNSILKDNLAKSTPSDDNIDMELIGFSGVKKTQVVKNVQRRDVDPVDEMSSEEREAYYDSLSVNELQQLFATAEGVLTDALKDLETFESNSETKIIQRNANYFNFIKSIESMFRNNVQNYGDALSMYSPEKIDEIATFLVSQPKLVDSRREYWNILRNLYEAFVKRNEIAKRLKRRVEPIIYQRDKYAFWYGIFWFCLPIACSVWLTTIAPEGAAMESPERNIKESDFEKGWGISWTKSIANVIIGKVGQVTTRYLGQWLTSVGLTGSSMLEAFSYKTWLNLFARALSAEGTNVVTAKATWPLIVEYSAIAISGASLAWIVTWYCYQTSTIFASIMVDVYYGVGHKKVTTDDRGVTQVSYEKLNFASLSVFLKRVTPGFTFIMGYGVQTLIMGYISLVASRAENLKNLFGSMPSFLSFADPMGVTMRYFDGYKTTKNDLKRYFDRISFSVSDDIWNRALPQSIELKAPLIYESLREPLNAIGEDHPLRTGYHVVKQLNRSDTELRKRLEARVPLQLKGTVEETDSSEFDEDEDERRTVELDI